MGKRHLTRAEIIAQCNQVARETRMAERTPVTTMQILIGYTLYKSEGFKAKRILAVKEAVDSLNDAIESGKVKAEQLSDNLMQKAEWSIQYEEYTEKDIPFKKGSFDYYITERQLWPQNKMNEIATRFMLSFYTTMMDKYGYGKDRLTRLQDFINGMLLEYQKNRSALVRWQEELRDYVGLIYEMPLDPLTMTRGSVMTGGYN